jgi:hypothetical protein
MNTEQHTLGSFFQESLPTSQLMYENMERTTFALRIGVFVPDQTINQLVSNYYRAQGLEVKELEGFDTIYVVKEGSSDKHLVTVTNLTVRDRVIKCTIQPGLK